MKYKNRQIVLYLNNFHFIFSFRKNINIRFNYRRNKKSNKWRHIRIIFFENFTNKEHRHKRDRRFRGRNAIVRIRPKLKLFAVEYWETSYESRKQITKLKTKGSFRVEICPSGELEIPARSWD